jgi:membrane-associated phospholipid phosphatase
MLPGFVDTGLRFDQSVYSNGLPIDQLSAMPSIHVAWAALLGYYVWRVSPSRWRFVGPAHTVITCVVVVVTANHWWLDGIAGVAILVVSAWLVAGSRAGFATLRRRTARARRGVAPESVADGVDIADDADSAVVPS